MNNQEEIPRYRGKDAELRLMTRDEVQALNFQLPRNFPIELGAGIRGRLIAILPVTGSLLVEPDNGGADVEILLHTEHTIH